MTFSLNELQATVRKAARGAGWDWGSADEIGRALRWLAANGCDGTPALAEVLGARSAPCPLQTGLRIADTARRLPDSFEVTATYVGLTLPFLANAARVRRCGWTVRAPNQTLTLTAEAVEGDAQGLLSPEVRTLSVSAAASLNTPAPHSRATPDPQAWARLMALAHKTYAPATEASRLMGAGAGTSDND